MLINGVDLDGLGSQVETIGIPEPVQGRVVHIDADFLAYQCSAERADGSDMKTWDDMKHNASVAVKALKELAGATAVHLHLTPSSSDKGKRRELAIIKEYQANREDKVKPRYLNVMREHLAKTFPATMHQNCEADDGMSSAQYAAIARGEERLSVIASKDKDLNMVPGLHLDWDLGTIHGTINNGFGEVYLKSTAGGTKKLAGYGQKFFWGQMLTGDTADNISGLPKLVGSLLNKAKPTAVISKAAEVYTNPSSTPQQIERALGVLRGRSAGAIGPVLALAVLDELHTARECFEYVKEAYRLYGEEFGYTHWQTGEAVPWNRAFVSEAQLLWMRAQPSNPLCVVNYFKEIVK